MDDLYRLSARRMVDLLRRGEVTPIEALEAALARIAATDGALNAVPTVCAERAREAAAGIPRDGPETEHPGWLAGLPVAIKDLVDVAGVRTTYGSPIHADHVPRSSDILVETLEKRGAVVVAKTNTPEFGAGAVTFNEVFGKTRNPWNTARTCGGSSGGSAVALAAGQAWLATGSDLGGSLRIPAAFCSVVGLRPGAGRIARGPKLLPEDTLSVAGPMARTVGDVALMLDAMAGRHPRDSLSLPAPGESFQEALAARRAPARIAYSPDLGLGPVDGEVAAICRRAAERLGELGAAVEEAHPDLSDAVEVFQVLRAANFAANLKPTLEAHREALKPEVVWNIEKGLALSGDDIERATDARRRLQARVGEFFATYDLLVCPATIVPPFDIDLRYVEEIDGHTFETYIDWFAITFAITLTGCPALSLPCGFTADGLPVGLQMVGRADGEAGLLSAAALAEELFEVAPLLPIDPRGPDHDPT